MEHTLKPFRFYQSTGLLVALALLWGCGPRVVALKGARFYYEKGATDLEKGRCLNAIEAFQTIVNNFPGDSLVADAQYYLAEAYFCHQDYIEAIFEYQRLLDTYPSSQWADEAQFQIGEAYFEQLRRPELDQKETLEALTYFRRFIDDNPDSPLVPRARERIVQCRSRLAEKVFLGAWLYHKQGRLEAAAMTYEDVLRGYPDTPWYCKALANLGEIAYEQGDQERARGYWEEVVRYCEDERLARDARAGLEKLEKSRGD